MAWRAREVEGAFCVFGRAAAVLLRTLGLRHVRHQITRPRWLADCREDLALILRMVGSQGSVLVREDVCSAFHVQTRI